MDINTVRHDDIEVRVKRAIDVLEAIQPEINAVVTFIDPKEQLVALDGANQNSPLYGVPVVLKDNISTKGIRTTASSAILDNYVPVFDAAVVTKLREAGAVMIAKASMDELGMGGTNQNAHTGEVNNPWDPSRIAGGSSGGSAVSVACGAVAVAIGTDTGDSVRKPAAYNGIIGVKPTYGRISRYGVIPYASSLDHVGYFTSSVEDAAGVLEALAGRDDRDMTTSYRPVENYAANLNADMKGKKIAVLGNVLDAIDNEEIKANFNNLVSQLKEAGATVEVKHLDETLMNAALSVYYIIANAEATANHANLDGVRFGLSEDGESVEEVMLKTRTKGFCSYVRKRFVIGSYSLFAENQDRILGKAQKIRRLIVDEYKKLFDGFDAVLAPAAGSIAPKHEESYAAKISKEANFAECHMVLANFSGFPSMTIPSGFVDTMPVGISITTKAFDEQTMFNVAYAMEEMTLLKGNDVEVDA